MKPTDISNIEYFHKVIDCQYACPAHTRVPEYIRLISEGRYDEAYMVNRESNVFPGILGRVCDRPCETPCRRSRVEEQPVAICRLKRVSADNKTTVTLPDIPTEKNGKKIGLIGGGPASLTVANDLMPLGYEIDLYDDKSSIGGFVRSQVPSFRLPEDVLNEEVNYILDMGVNVHKNHYISSFKEFLKKEYDAIFIGTGAPRGRDLPDLPGRKEGDDFIHVGIDWLASVMYGHVKSCGNKVLVIGGGNTAMDCCRTARRMGGNDVKVIIRGSRQAMTASPWEVEDALEEDIPIIEFHRPRGFVVEDNRLVGMEFDRVVPITDDTGATTLTIADEAPVVIECDEVLLAIGQLNALPWIEPDLGLELNEWGLPVLDETTYQSTLDHVFFGGDAAFGPQNIITAVAHGHNAAVSIDLFCQGKPLADRPSPQVSLAGQKIGFHEWIYDSQTHDFERHVVPTVDKVKSIQDRLIEVELGYDREHGHKEALRCLNCDVQTVFDAALCIECDACVDICPTSCINFTQNGSEEELRSRLRAPADDLSQDLYVSPPLPTGRVMVKDENVCLHCGLCAERCPTSAWQMQKYIYHTVKAGEK